MTPFPTRAQRKKKLRRAFSKFMSQARAVAAAVTSRRQKLFLTHVFFYRPFFLPPPSRATWFPQVE